MFPVQFGFTGINDKFSGGSYLEYCGMVVVEPEMRLTTLTNDINTSCLEDKYTYSYGNLNVESKLFIKSGNDLMPAIVPPSVHVEGCNGGSRDHTPAFMTAVIMTLCTGPLNLMW